jgi:hypothetical protein
MTKEDIIRMAREAGWQYANGDDGYEPLWKFGELIAAAEREACAKLCDKGSEQMLHKYQREGASRCAEAIRARGQ